MGVRILFALAFFTACLRWLPAFAVELPRQLDPPAPFPAILNQVPSEQTIAPGVTYGTYTLQTAVGPEAIHIVAVAPGHSDVRVGTMLANDALESSGESVVSMAQRSGAVAGINGDYFDIGNSNRPTNIVVQNGQLLQTPRKRYAFFIAGNGTPTISEVSFIGQIQLSDKTVGLDAVDTMSPNGGVTLLTPQYGNVAPSDSLTLVGLVPTSGTPPFATYRVTGVLDNLQQQPPGYYLAIGINAYATVGVPNAGDTIAASGDLSPLPLSNIAAAVGGGPMILQNGAWFADPDGPNGPGYSARIPCSGAAIAPDGTLFLLEVDGRQPLESVGITRPEFAALMRSLGATQGLAFDGGGSSGMAVRLLGQTAATAQGSPSDGSERRVADGLFVYNTDPIGPPARIVAIPNDVRMLPGATLALRLAAIDTHDHTVPPPAPIAVGIEPANLATYRDGRLEALRPGTGTLQLHSGELATILPLTIDAAPARVVISPPQANVARGEQLRLGVAAYDARGFPLTMPAQLAWRASSGSVDADGLFKAGAHNAVVGFDFAGRRYQTTVTVGAHDVPLDFATHARFFSVPSGGSGSVVRDPSCPGCVQLTFALGESERAAYALVDLPLPRHVVGLSFDVRDDGSGALVKVALRNAIGEQILVPATRLNHPGWRTVRVRFPASVAGTARLVALYAIGAPPGHPLGGSIVFRNVRAIVAGSR
ncbi:MAG TPA: phosphodiester glycosidase family protein [Candidatus Dormibacteraeota bacterium]|nr:phosphodiester glycosidase family protein [Candidatus Dormibacteraeota bacterium]